MVNGRTSSRPSAISLDIPALDSCLPGGGLAGAGLHEIQPAADRSGFRGGAQQGPATGFAAWLLGRCAGAREGAVLWCRRQGGVFDPPPYAPGLLPFLDPGRLLLVEARREEDVLWAMEEGLRCRGLAAVLGEVRGADLTATRRLQLAAESNGIPALLLRAAATGRTSAALSRWQVAAAPSVSTPGLRDIAGLRWRVSLLRVRGMTGGDQESSWLMEWRHDADNDTGRLALVSPTLDRPAGPAFAALARAPGYHGGDGLRRAAGGGGQ